MAKDPLDIFRSRMKKTREQKGITLHELADKVGCKEATMQRYESGNGIKNVPYEAIVTISESLNVSPGFLMGWETPEANNDDPELLADIAGDRKILDCWRKLQQLNEDDREKVYSYVDYIFSNKK